MLITALHVSYRTGQHSGPASTGVSDLILGTRIGPIQETAVLQEGVAQAGQAQDTSLCRVIVAFSPTCPHCIAAAQAEAERVPNALRLPITWVASLEPQDLQTFTPHVRKSSRVSSSSNAFEVLQVKAVPAGFLVDSDQTVKYSWVYSGQENHQSLLSRCE